MRNRKRNKITLFQFYETLNSVEGFFLLLANQQAGATTRFGDTRAFHVAQSPKKILFTFACVFMPLDLHLVTRKITTNLLKHGWAKTGPRIPQRLEIYWKTTRVSCSKWHTWEWLRFPCSTHFIILRGCIDADSREERLGHVRGTFYHVHMHFPH